MKVLALLVSLLMFASSTNLKLNFHLCHNHIAEVNLWNESSNHCKNMMDHGCHMPSTKTEISCCVPDKKAENEPENCCDDESIELSLNEPFTVNKQKINIEFSWINLPITLNGVSPIRFSEKLFIDFSENINAPPIYLICNSLIFYG